MLNITEKYVFFLDSLTYTEIKDVFHKSYVIHVWWSYYCYRLGKEKCYRRLAKTYGSN